MITSSGKQDDKVAETSIIHLMQMYMFVIEVQQKSEYHYSLPSWHTFGAVLGICRFFLKSKTALWSGKESVKSVALTMQPFESKAKSQSKVTAVSGNVYQSKSDVHSNSQLIHIFQERW